MRTGSLLFLLGVLVFCRLPHLPPAWLLLGLAAVVPLLSHRRLRWPAIFACGFLWALLRAQLALAPALAPELEGRTLLATGRIASLPAIDPERTRFEFEISRLEDERGRPLAHPGRVRLGWYRDARPLIAGESWQLPVRLKRPVGFSNPGGFDYEAWLFGQRIRATGYVAAGERRRLAPAPAVEVDRIRQQLRDAIAARYPDRARAALLTALVVGDTSDIARPDWDVLTRTGTSHLLAISGLHIALVAGFCFLLVRRAWPWLGSAPLWLPAPRAAAIAAVFGAACYAALAGFAVPTQRALVMVLVWTIAAGLLRRTAFSHVLAASLLAVLVFDPFAVLAPGFWLSFGAVAAIGFGMGGRIGAGDVWQRWGRVQWVVSVGLLPVLVLWFHQLPLFGIPANLLAVPWISLLTVPLVLLGSLLGQLVPALGGMLLDLALASIELLWPALRILAGLQFGMLAVPAAEPLAFAAAAVGVVLLLLPRGVPGRWLGWCWMLPLLVPRADLPDRGEFRLTLLDVGQGQAVVVRTRGHVLLYDAGPGFGGEFSAGSAVVLPYLRQAGITRLDLLLLSHGDNDHAGGLGEVLRGIPVGRLLGNVPSPDVERCRTGQRWDWDGVTFEILHPPPAGGFEGNDGSCVLHVSAAGRAALIPGDIERRAEQALLRAVPEQLAAQILIAPHHGSRTSSSEAFIAAVHPDLVLFPVGYRNRFGFPKQDILSRYQRHGAAILDTARSGAIDIRLHRAGFSVHTHRRDAQRFWHSRI